MALALWAHNCSALISSPRTLESPTEGGPGWFQVARGVGQQGGAELEGCCRSGWAVAVSDQRSPALPPTAATSASPAPGAVGRREWGAAACSPAPSAASPRGTRSPACRPPPTCGSGAPTTSAPPGESPTPCPAPGGTCHSPEEAQRGGSFPKHPARVWVTPIYKAMLARTLLWAPEM